MALALAGPRHGAVHRSVRDMAVAGVRWRLEREREREGGGGGVRAGQGQGMAG